MKKLLLTITVVLLLFGCNSNNNGVLAPVTNNYSGDWTLNYSGDAVGSATVGIQGNGKLENGIILDSLNTGKMFRVDIFGDVNGDDGSLTADIKFFQDENVSGTMSGIFSDSANGSYTIFYSGFIIKVDTLGGVIDTAMVPNVDTLKGNWTAKLRL